VKPFASAQEHLLAELQRIDELIRLQVWRARRLQQGDERFLGLYVSDEEVDRLLAGPADLPRWAHEDAEPLAEPARERSRRAAAAIAARAQATEQAGIHLPLRRLARLFALGPRELDILLVALAPEIDLRYERLFGYLQDDITKKRPSIDLVLNLLCRSLADKLAARTCLTPAAPLLRRQLLVLSDDPAQPSGPLPARQLHVDPRVAAYLLGQQPGTEPGTEPGAGGETDERLAFALRLRPPLPPGDAPPGDAPASGWPAGEGAAQLRALLERRRAQGGQLLVYLQGPYGSGKRDAAFAIASAEGRPLLALDLEALAAHYAADAPGFATALALAQREALLLDAVPCWEQFDTLFADERAPLLKVCLRAIATASETASETAGDTAASAETARAETARAGSLLLLAGSAAWEPADTLRTLHFVRLVLPSPNRQARRLLWQAALGAAPAPEPEIETIADRFRLTPGQIADAAATARNLAQARASTGPLTGPVTGPITAADLYAACRLHSSRRLAELAQHIAVPYTWNDLVLPPDRQRQLQEIVAQVRHRALVIEQWGFGARLALGKGLVALFAGPSGTGKTMAAGIMANELGLDLYRIDLSAVVSKYIGETEKNLARIFHEAESSNAILFFDEADALFGRRSEVRDSHDRYANIETSYLLQRMEEYDGLAILATNLQKNMDEAFVRRLHFAVEFPLPDARSRRRIWAQIWPPAAPLAGDLDLDFLAQRFPLTGGNIRNIALAATYLAAGNGRMVTMEHLVRATQREYQKMGKVMLGDEFGKYEPLTLRSS